ncbi:MAG: CapA family protein [Lachnospiraceae bacterium]|nr:CapA family protein [Lachnospiraceae bacterium]
MKKKICLIGLMLSMAFATACSKNEKAKSTDATPVESTEDKSENTSEKETEPETTPEPFIAAEVNIMMVGDVLIHETARDSGKKSDGTYNYDHFFRMITDELAWGDINIVNQEVILGGKDLGLTCYPQFNGAYELGDSLANVGFNVVLHATNHTMDKWEKGVNNCIEFWKTHPEVAVLGINETPEDAEEIYVYEKYGIKIAILNYTYGTNGIPLPEDRPYLVNLLEEERVINDLKKAEEIADFTVVCPHWGSEYTHTPTEHETYWAEIFIENGADLIIGTHPHVIQPVEWVESTNGNKALVYWSLGNFVSNQDLSRTMLEAMAKVTVTNDRDGNVFIKDYEVQPLVNHYVRGEGKMCAYKIEDYNEDLASVNRIHVWKDGSKFSHQYCIDLAEEVFGDEWNYNEE